MKKKENIIKLIELYEEYLSASVSERTHELTDLENGGKKKVIFKGDLEGFISYLKKFYGK